MHEKLARVILFMVLAGLSAMSQQVSRTKAAGGIIYIKNDGSILPLDAPIFTSDSITYTLTNDINASIAIERDNIILNGANHTIQNPQGLKGVDLSFRNNVTVTDLEIKSFSYGIFLLNSSDNRILRTMLVSNDYYGIEASFSLHNTIAENKIISNEWAGIHFYHCDRNDVSENTVTNGFHGIYLYRSLYNTIQRNSINKNAAHGIWLDNQSNNCTIARNNITTSQNGIYFSIYTHYCQIAENAIANNEKGILLSQTPNNNIFANNLTNNKYGIYMFFSSNNTLYHNNFVNNTKQAHNENSTNTWDNGYPDGGNFWSDYTGIDGNGDGIGDSQYAVDENNADNYPLLREYIVSEFPNIVVLPLFIAASLTVAYFLIKRSRYGGK